MIINYEIEKIDQMLKDFYHATGINMDLLNENFLSVGNKSFWEKKKYCKAIQNTNVGKQACICSDNCLLKKSRDSKKPEMHICHGGLVDISVPVLYNDAIIGYLIFGQIRMDSDFSKVEEYLSEIGLDKNELRKYYSQIPLFTSEQIEGISNIAQMLVRHILLENLLKPDFDEIIQKTVYYINENMERELTVDEISHNVNISKSSLYRSFHNYFNCTVSQYVNRKRIEKAMSLLSESSLSIEEIALRTGFSSGSYFSKMFKKEKGISPLKYRKQRSRR